MFGTLAAQSDRIFDVMRILVGINFATHGAQKLFGWSGGLPEGIPAFITSVHPLQYRARSEGMDDRLHPTPFFEEEAFEKVGRPDHATVAPGKRKWAMQASKSSRKALHNQKEKQP